MSARPGRILPALAAALAGVQVGAAIVATRFVIDQTGPASLGMMRYLIGALFLLPFVLASRNLRFARRDLVPIALLGIVQFGVTIVCLNFGLRYVPSARAALILATFPLLVMLLAALWGRERMTGTKSFGVTLTVLGVAVALGERALTAETTPSEWIGAVAVFLAALFGAGCSVLYRPYLRRYSTLPIGFFAMTASVMFLAASAWFEGMFTRPLHITATGWVAVGFIGISSGVGYFLWLWALNHTTPTSRSSSD